MTDAKKIARNWFHKLGDFQLMDRTNQYNTLNLLAGYLQACEEFGHLTHDQAAELFTELTE
jgi:hypothetical protein